MKTLVLLVGLVAVAAGEINWSKVKPIQEFDQYWTRLPEELQSLRYSTPTKRITNGQEATPGQFPYQVALVLDFAAGSGLCGGSILSNNFILTAAHCVDGASGGVALVGAHNRLDNEPFQQSIVFERDGITMHPEHAANTFRNDVALIRLTNPIQFNERAQPVRLPERTDSRTFSGMQGTISGFGQTSDNSPTPSPVLRYTSNPIITIANCLEQWNNAVHIVQEQNMCLSGNGARSSCNGDSGGPLTVQDAGSTLQVGVVSFISQAGCYFDRPSIFARITHFLEWIEQNSDVRDSK